MRTYGFQVLPLHHPTPVGCSCGKADCKSPAKHPRTKRGVKSASNDPNTIERWQVLFPDANWGVATGAVSGVVVLDIDAKGGGLESLAQLEKEHGELPKTPKVKTGGGGAHYWFLPAAEPLGNRSGILPGVDFRGENGYVVCPPSVHASGKKYEFEIAPNEIALAPMPDWLSSLVRREEKPTAEPTSATSGNFDAALAAMRKITMQDGKDGTRRLFCYCCRAIEHGLNDEDAIRAIRIMELEKPFP